MNEQTRWITTTRYEPWLLGWCRWSVKLDVEGPPGIKIHQQIFGGRWLWRGRNAKHEKYRFAVGGVEDLS